MNGERRIRNAALSGANFSDRLHQLCKFIGRELDVANILGVRRGMGRLEPYAKFVMTRCASAGQADYKGRDASSHHALVASDRATATTFVRAIRS